MADNAIRDTDTDAAVSRLSAVTCGYLNDPFARYFVKRSQRRPPLINIGTFLRTWALDKLVRQFLASNNHSPKQIISLGAGTDTRFFRLHQGGATDEVRNSIARYVEVDFPECTTKKAMALRKNAALSEAVGSAARLEHGGTSLVSDKYMLLPGDLRNFDELEGRLFEALDTNLPTLLIAECVFIYLSPAHSDHILRRFTNMINGPVACVMYDPVGLDDNFGKVMINNLKARGIDLLGSPANMSLSRQVERLREIGFEKAFSRDVRQIRKKDIGTDEWQRLTQLEMLDEIEELDLLLSHYSITWGYTNVQQQGVDGIELAMTLDR